MKKPRRRRYIPVDTRLEQAAMARASQGADLRELADFLEAQTPFDAMEFAGASPGAVAEIKRHRKPARPMPPHLRELLRTGGKPVRTSNPTKALTIALSVCRDTPTLARAHHELAENLMRLGMTREAYDAAHYALHLLRQGKTYLAMTRTERRRAKGPYRLQFYMIAAHDYRRYGGARMMGIAPRMPTPPKGFAGLDIPKRPNREFMKLISKRIQVMQERACEPKPPRIPVIAARTPEFI